MAVSSPQNAMGFFIQTMQRLFAISFMCRLPSMPLRRLLTLHKA